MKFFNLLAFALLIVSCASTSSSKEWGPWVAQDLASHERKWDMCHEEMHGKDLHEKGFCWSMDECRTRKTILGNVHKECRVKIIPCLFKDEAELIKCMHKYQINRGQIIIGQ